MNKVMIKASRNKANPAEFDPPSAEARIELEARIARLRALAVSHDDPETSARLMDLVIVLEVELLEMS